MSWRMELRSRIVSRTTIRPDSSGSSGLVRTHLRLWDDASLGMAFEDLPVPPELAEAARVGPRTPRRSRGSRAHARRRHSRRPARGCVPGRCAGTATLMGAIRRCTLHHAAVPVLCGSASATRGSTTSSTLWWTTCQHPATSLRWWVATRTPALARRASPTWRSRSPRLRSRSCPSRTVAATAKACS